VVADSFSSLPDTPVAARADCHRAARPGRYHRRHGNESERADDVHEHRPTPAEEAVHRTDDDGPEDASSAEAGEQEAVLSLVQMQRAVHRKLYSVEHHSWKCEASVDSLELSAPADLAVLVPGQRSTTRWLVQRARVARHCVW
jgi:hypothetical protein